MNTTYANDLLRYVSKRGMPVTADLIATALGAPRPAQSTADAGKPVPATAVTKAEALAKEGGIWVDILAAVKANKDPGSAPAEPARPPEPAPPVPPVVTPPPPPVAKIKSAQLAGEIWLQNDHLSIGVNAGGTLGTKGNVPQGFARDEVGHFTRSSMVAIDDKGGVSGDLMLAGTPVEGFAVGYKDGGTTRRLVNSLREGRQDILGAPSYVFDEAHWKGGAGPVFVEQVISLKPGEDFVTVEIILTNTSAGILNDVRYMRFVDPDQGPEGNFVTTGKVEAQGLGQAALSATARGVRFFYGTDDPRAVVAILPGYKSRDPYVQAFTVAVQKAGFTLAGDNTSHLTFLLGNLNPSASVSFKFAMGMTSNLSAALASIA